MRHEADFELTIGFCHLNGEAESDAVTVHAEARFTSNRLYYGIDNGFVKWDRAHIARECVSVFNAHDYESTRATTGNMRATPLAYIANA